MAYALADLAIAHGERFMSNRHIRFCLLDMATVSHNNYGLWAHPANRHAGYTDIEYWCDMARLLERGLFDAIFFADVLAISEGFGGGHDVAIREGMHVPSADPFLIIPVMAAVTRHLGFAVTGSTTYEPPFSMARRLSTLDHMTKGRIGWNVVTSYLPGAALNFGLDDQLSHDERYDRAEEYLEVVYKLWEGSWEDDAVLADRVHQIYADPAKVHRIEHKGTYYSVRGPHLVSPSPQRTPVLFQAGSSGRGRAFAGRHAEGVFVGGYTREVLGTYVKDLRSIAAASGRHPTDIKTFAQCHLVVAHTEAEAQAKLACFQSLSRADGHIAHRFGSGMDLTRYARSEVIADIVAAGGPGAEHIARYPFPPGTTVGDVYEEAARVDGRRLFAAGNARQVADTIEGWVDEFGIDGFLLSQMISPGSIEDFVDLVVPELQRRGRYRLDYAESTLRERFSGPGQVRLPDHHPAAAFR
jgi:FMN-dependent oxidoreductase (nitrilotriacetate monooxygenase family)